MPPTLISRLIRWYRRSPDKADLIALAIGQVALRLLASSGYPPELLAELPGGTSFLPTTPEPADLHKILNQYTFTINEHPADGAALTPAILGALYEQLLAEQSLTPGTSARRASGTFYTPPEIVTYLAIEALANRLAAPNRHADRLRRLFSGEPHDFDAAERSRLVESITRLKILDPACGCGAFMIVLVELLARALCSLDPYGRDWLALPDYSTPERQAGIRAAFEEGNCAYAQRLIALTCLYGVDIQPAAIEITRLRCALMLLESLPVQPVRDYRSVIGNTVPGDASFDPCTLPGCAEGFDCVVGNPPYIKEYTNRAAFDSLRDSPYYQGKMDLWHLFACRAIDLLRHQGILAFIVTNNWPTSAGATILRTQIAARTQIIQLLDFGAARIFKGAGIQTMIMICRKDSQEPRYQFDYRRMTDPTSGFQPHSHPGAITLRPLFDRAAMATTSFTFSDPQHEAILEQITSAANFALDPRTEIAQGIIAPQEYVMSSHRIPGSDYRVGEGIFVLSKEEKDAFPPAEQALFKPLYTPSELRRYYGDTPPAHWIIYTTSRFRNPQAIQPYPTIQRHLERFAAIMTSDHRPYGLHRSRDPRFFSGEKILALRKCAIPCFTYTDFDCYVTQTYNIIQSARVDLRYLTGLLNSKVIAFWLRHRGKMQGNHFQLDAQPLATLPLVIPPYTQQAPIIDIMIQIRARLREDRWAVINDLVAQIDAYVCRMYGVNDSSISN